MPNVGFVVQTRSTSVGVEAYGRRRTLVRVPVLRVESTVEALCNRGAARFGADAIQLIGGSTALDDVTSTPTVRFLTGRRKPADTEGRDGAEVVTLLTMTLSEIKVRVEVVVERRFNTAPVAGQRGPAKRPLAVPDYRALARTVIACKLNQTIDGWRRLGGKWQEFSRKLPETTHHEEGLFGNRIFLRDAACDPIEPPAGTRYNAFEDVAIGSLERGIS